MNSLAGSRVILWAAQQCDVNGLEKSLACQGCHLQIVKSFDELRAVMERHDVDLIVARLCHSLRRPLLELLSWVRDIPSPPPVVIVADSLDVDLYLEAMRRGAFDCVGLPLNEKVLVRIMAHALEGQYVEAYAGGRGK